MSIIYPETIDDTETKIKDRTEKEYLEPTALDSPRSKKIIKSVRFPFEETAIRNEHKKRIVAVILKMLQDSSVYAVSKLGSSSSWRMKLMWFLVLFVSLSGCCYEISRFLTLYFQYPVVISLQVENEWEVQFPTVSVCNLNRIRMSILENDDKCLSSGLDKESCFELLGEDVARSFLSTERMKFATCSGHSSRKYSPFYSKMQVFLNTYNKVNEESLQNAGHQAKDFIKSCSFNGELCSEKNFSIFHNRQYGNCFTFNGKTSAGFPNLTTQNVGPNSGLELELDIEADEYMMFSPAVGARVVINHPSSDPNPEDHGIDLTPGYQTSVAIKQTSIRRLPHPYKDRCRVYEDPGDNHSTSQEHCVRWCVQTISLLQCHCVDPSMRAPENATHCTLNNKTQVCFLDKILKNVGSHRLPCDCPLPCLKTDYEMTLSSAIWPSEEYFKDSELFSHLGGQMGLWLGLSIVAIFECVEALMLLIGYVFKRRTE